jgi:hypothetical protein
MLKAMLRQLKKAGLDWRLKKQNTALWSVHAFSSTSASGLSFRSATNDLDNCNVGRHMEKNNKIAGQMGRTLCVSGGRFLLIACVEGGVLVAVPSGMQVTRGIVEKAAAAAAKLPAELQRTVKTRCLVVNLGEVRCGKLTWAKTKAVRTDVQPFSVLSWSPQRGLYLLVRSLLE